MQIYLLEEPNMKKIVALVLSLVMALSLCTVAFADGYDIEVTKKGEHTKYDELKSVAQTDTVLPHYEGTTSEFRSQLPSLPNTVAARTATTLS